MSSEAEESSQERVSSRNRDIPRKWADLASMRIIFLNSSKDCTCGILLQCHFLQIIASTEEIVAAKVP